ncbi:PRC-barrel domain-containing protein [Indioceanicola profundi]|uniref:PRC-barrel domain-containing protein n=1 Tax=Indioceanicola profundi TaxID=2220096 RepID=UPI000E6AB438|nr:PRC-barrel domain-containing protein [Indioceanicola profundi]
MKSLMIATAMGLALSAPALAQQGPGGPHHPHHQHHPAGRDRQASGGNPAARMVSATQLIRKNVVTADDQDLGRVDYIVVDPETGSIATLLIRVPALSGQNQEGQEGAGPAGNQGGQQDGQQSGAPLLAMPWHAIDVTQGGTGEIVAQVPMQVARQVPTLTDAEISRITSPRVMARLVEYYAPAPGGGSGGQGGASSQMVIGHGVVGMLTPPAVTTVDQMQGLAITTPDGTRIGEIQSVMIDIERGAVSYLLALQQSSANRLTRNTPPLGTGFVPIAYQDVELASDGQSFVLAPDAMVVGVVAMPQDQNQNRGSAAQNRQAQAGGQRGYGPEAYRGSGGNPQAAQSNRSGQQASAQPQLGGQSGRQGLDRYVEAPAASAAASGQQQNAEAGQGAQQQDAAQPSRIRRLVLGTVRSIDRQNRTLTLENGSSFQLARNIDPNSISKGDPVRVSYRVQGNSYQAVAVRPAPESALSGGAQADASTGPIDGTDAPGATDDPRRPQQQRN